MIIIEGALPFIWLPIWWFGIRDHPKEAKWLSAREREHIETKLAAEAEEMRSRKPHAAGHNHEGSWKSIAGYLAKPVILVMLGIYFLHNCAAYGCMTFFTAGLKGRGFTQLQYGLLFAAPYVLTAIIMIVNSWHSDKTHERRGHAAIVYLMSGVSLILSVSVREHFWVSYVLLCFAIPGPFAAMAPFWSIATETMPRAAAGVAIGLVNAFGNLGGFVGPTIVGWLSKAYNSTAISFNALGIGMLVAAGLCFLLPKRRE